MNQQLRSLIKALLWGFGVSAITQLDHFFKNGLGPHEVDPFDVFDPIIFAYWFGSLGGVPLLFVMVTIVIKRNLVNFTQSVLNFLIATLFICLIPIIFSIGLNFFYPIPEFPFLEKGPFRDEIVQSGYNGCASRLLRNGYKADEIKDLCICVANEVADSTTALQMKADIKSGAPQMITNNIVEAYSLCVKK